METYIRVRISRICVMEMELVSIKSQELYTEESIERVRCRGTELYTAHLER
jgi:hypothetical protein